MYLYYGSVKVFVIHYLCIYNLVFRLSPYLNANIIMYIYYFALNVLRINDSVPTYIIYTNENYIIIKASMLRVSIQPPPHEVSLLNVHTLANLY